MNDKSKVDLALEIAKGILKVEAHCSGPYILMGRIYQHQADSVEYNEGLTNEQLEEVADEIPAIYTQPTDGDHCGNVRFDKGTYVGHTVHEVFQDRGEMAIKFFKFVLKSQVYNGSVYEKAVTDYCKLRGVDLS